MKAPAFGYAVPASLPEALDLLAEYGEDARLLAGGQSLVPMLNLRLAAPAMLIDLNRVGCLAGIEAAADGGLTVGAMTRERALERDPRVARSQPLLASVLPHIAHVAIRNRGTLGGSLAHADPAAELPAAALACDAVLVLERRGGRREVTAEAFFQGVFATALEGDEALVAVRFPPWPAARAWGFREVARRRGDFALAGIAAWLDRDADGRCTAARVVAIGCGDRPLRLRGAEAALIGRIPDAATVDDAAEAAHDDVEPDGDLHASEGYRREVAAVLTRRVLGDAMCRERAA